MQQMTRLEVHFSEEPELSSANMQDHVLSVTNGGVKKVKRKTQGSNNPLGDHGAARRNNDVTIALSATTDCSANGAVCTENGRMLSNASAITVPGPAVPPPPSEPPPAPTGLTATRNADGSITLTWTAPDDASVTGYQMLRRRPEAGEDALTVYVADTGSAATTYTDTGTDPDTRYV